MFHQPGYLIIDKLNNVFRKLHEAGFCYKIHLEHIPTTKLAKMAEMLYLFAYR